MRACREHARQVVGDAAAGDVGHAFDEGGLAWSPIKGRTTDRYDRCGTSSASPIERPSAGIDGVHGQPGAVERNAPRQRVAVGVQSGRGKTDEDVPRGDGLAVDQLPPRNDADDESRNIVLAVGVEARHLGGLAAKQRATVSAARAREPLDNLHGDVRVQPAGGQIVEEEERVGALHEDVVDAVVHEVHADRRVHAGHERDPQLGPDAVGARDEHRIVPAGVTEPEEPAERPNLGQHPRCERAARERPNPANDLVAGVDVDAALLVIHVLC